MKRVWWVVAGLAALVFLYVTALPGDLAVGRDDADGLAGVYTINGIDETGAEYSGTVVIADAGSGRYDVEWIITNGIQRGSGVFQGDTFTTTWEATSGPLDATGTTVYTVADDGRLVGTRRVDGSSLTASEELFPDG